MRVVVVTPPDPVVTLDQAKAHLRVDAGDDDALITALVAAATQHLDGPMGWLGRAIGVQTLQARAAFFDRTNQWFLLPCPPVAHVDAVEYLDTGGVAQTLDPAKYEVRGSAVVCRFGQRWPAVRCDDESVRVTYHCGYDTAPAPIVAAILLMVGDLYAFRETAVTGAIAAAIPMSATVDALLTPYRLFA